MQIRRREQFSTVRTEGPILPPDLLRHIAENDRQLDGLTPEAYHLAPGERLNEMVNRSWNRLLGAWAAFRASTATQGATDAALTGVTRDRWLYPLFQELGYGRLPPARGIEVGGAHYAVSHVYGATPIHLVGAGVDLDRRAAGVAGAARVSPHGLVQELLNRSDAHLWGFVSNGLRLRVLRDNVSITRQSFVEWDLEAMMDGEVYADFALLWLVCHQSRVETPAPDYRPEQCWLEKWTRTAQEQGTRALEQLRTGVEQAIAALGRGFLAHGANTALREALQRGPASGGLDTQDYYRQLLRLVYRLLFLFVAEDRGALLDPQATDEARRRYTAYYSTARLRRLADRRIGTRHHDLYHALRLVMTHLGADGCPPLALPALGGYLFSEGAVRDLAGCEIANHDLLDAVRALAFVEDGQARRLVDYRNLGAEELGSVYESLLELHPELDAGAAPPKFELRVASGNERKTTGSYYTPSSLIQCLLDSALDPVLEEAARTPDPEAAILALKVCDPACGSGHFLIAAAHRIAKRLAQVRTGEPEPSPEAVRMALRQVVGSCIYGVDLNPMAVELCKVSLWMEALEPGKPLTFLDHHIQSGNSLLGTTPALLEQGVPDAAFTAIEGDDKAFCTEFRKKNKQERAGQLTFFDADLNPWDHIGNLATALHRMGAVDGDTIQGQREKEQQYAQMVRSNDYLYGRMLADAWCAAFVWKKVRTPELPTPITQDALRTIERNPYHVSAAMRAEIMRLSAQYRFFHWHLAFPDVFTPPAPGTVAENEQAGWNGGFDVVLGNPPWEHVELKEHEWFAVRRPDIAAAPNAAQRKAMIADLEDDDLMMFHQYLEAKRQEDAERAFAWNCGRYPLTGRGRINTYAIFAETMRSIIERKGSVGCIVPTGIATDDTTRFYFQDIVDSSSLASIYSFENEDRIFQNVHHAYKFCLLTLRGTDQPRQSANFVFFARELSDVRDSSKVFSLSPEELALISPNTRTCPTFRSRRDAELTKSIHRRVPVLKVDGRNSKSWDLEFRQGLFNMAADSKLFNVEQSDGCLPLYEAKLFHQFDHRAATYDGATQEQLNLGTLPRLSDEEKNDPDIGTLPRYWIAESCVDERLRDRWQRGWLLGYRAIARSTDARTAIFATLPRVGVGHTAPLVFPLNASGFAPILGNLNSFVFDYVTRQKVAGANVALFALKQLPALPPEAYDEALLRWIVPRVLELTYTAWDLQPFAQDVGYQGPPFRWDEDRRFLLRAELDALYFHLYGIQRDDVEYIMETFPIVKRRDIQKHDEYRTKRVILEVYDALAQAEQSGVAYQSLLDPPPADLRVAHPQRDGSPWAGPGWTLPPDSLTVRRDGASRGAASEAASVTRAAAPAVTPASSSEAPARRGRASAGRVARRVERASSQPALLAPPLFETLSEPPAAAPPISEPAAPPGPDAELRAWALQACVLLLRERGPQTARQLTEALLQQDARITRRLLNQALFQDGAQVVAYDSARYLFSLRG